MDWPHYIIWLWLLTWLAGGSFAEPLGGDW